MPKAIDVVKVLHGLKLVQPIANEVKVEFDEYGDLWIEQDGDHIRVRKCAVPVFCGMMFDLRKRAPE